MWSVTWDCPLRKNQQLVQNAEAHYADNMSGSTHGQARACILVRQHPSSWGTPVTVLSSRLVQKEFCGRG